MTLNQAVWSRRVKFGLLRKIAPTPVSTKRNGRTRKRATVKDGGGGLERNLQSADGETVSSDLAVDSQSRAATSAATLNDLIWLTEVWSSPPEDTKAAMINIAREALPFGEYSEQAADAMGAGPL